MQYMTNFSLYDDIKNLKEYLKISPLISKSKVLYNVSSETVKLTRHTDNVIRSAIKPTDKEIAKKVKSRKIKPDKEIEFNDHDYQTYAENGFVIDPTDVMNQRTYKICYIRQQKLDFIARIDLSKGKFSREIYYMKRLKAPDYDKEGEETKPREWIEYQEYWRAKNWLGKKMFVTNVEGIFQEVTKELETEFDPKTGDVNAEYVQGKSRTRYYIPFSKKAVDEIIKKVGTDKDAISYMGIIPNSFKGVGFRCGNYTYDQFVSTTWEEFEDLARREGGPNLVKPQFAFGGKPYQ